MAEMVTSMKEAATVSANDTEKVRTDELIISLVSISALSVFIQCGLFTIENVGELCREFSDWIAGGA